MEKLLATRAVSCARVHLTIRHFVHPALMFFTVFKIVVYALSHFYFLFLAVLAAALNDLEVGAPLLPGLRIRSGVLPSAFCFLIRFRFAWIFA
jgi:hypothetical protein